MSTAPFKVHALDHVQLAMPAGQDAAPRAFYFGMPGPSGVPKPPNLARRGGAWFEGGTLRVHLGVEAEFRRARKAHPAFLTPNLNGLTARMEQKGVAVVADEPLEGYRRIYASDPFANRIELLDPAAGT